MNSPAIARPPRHSRLAMIVAGVLALLGSFVVTAPAQAGYYGKSYYGGPVRAPTAAAITTSRTAITTGAPSCGCYRRCYSTSRPGLIYERRYVEREYVERRYGWPARHYYGRRYGYNPYGGRLSSEVPIRLWRCQGRLWRCQGLAIAIRLSGRSVRLSIRSGGGAAAARVDSLWLRGRPVLRCRPVLATRSIMALDGTATLPRNHLDGGPILRGIGRPLGLPAPLALSISERCAHD